MKAIQFVPPVSWAPMPCMTFFSKSLSPASALVDTMSRSPARWAYFSKRKTRVAATRSRGAGAPPHPSPPRPRHSDREAAGGREGGERRRAWGEEMPGTAKSPDGTDRRARSTAGRRDVPGRHYSGRRPRAGGQSSRCRCSLQALEDALHSPLLDSERRGDFPIGSAAPP